MSTSHFTISTAALPLMHLSLIYYMITLNLCMCDNGGHYLLLKSVEVGLSWSTVQRQTTMRWNRSFPEETLGFPHDGPSTISRKQPCGGCTSYYLRNVTVASFFKIFGSSISFSLSRTQHRWPPLLSPPPPLHR